MEPDFQRHGPTAVADTAVGRPPQPPANPRRETDLTAAATVWNALTTSGIKLLSAKWIIGKAREAPSVGLGYDKLGRQVPLPKQVQSLQEAPRTAHRPPPTAHRSPLTAHDSSPALALALALLGVLECR